MAKSLLERLTAGAPVMAPGVGDALGARLVAEAGFECVYVSGFQVSATRGLPDIGLVTMNEMLAALKLICEAVDLPVVADADDGYGGPLNVARTVREYESAGVAGLHVEDQHAHRCGGAEGVQLIPMPEMRAKIVAALDARKSKDFLVIARTDASHTHEGIEGTIRRGKAYRAAGAGALMVTGVTTRDQLARCRGEIEGPLVITMGSRSDIPLSDITDIGYQLVIYPNTTLRLQMQAVRGGLRELKQNGVLDHTSPALCPYQELHHFLGFPRFRSLEEKYSAIAAEP